ncbi:MAG TPA: hypothetical protein VGL99_22505 [Chloroflexota bacterium]
MERLIRSAYPRSLLALVLALSLVTTACSGTTSAAPSQPGQYSVQKDSVHFDGERYVLYWADSANALHRLETRNLKMVRDPERNFLEVSSGGGDPVLHLREDEPITVDGRDREGSFGSPWFPFLAGAMIGNMFGGGRGPGPVIINNPAPGESRTYTPDAATYRYPPTGTFGRGDQLNGSLDSSRAQAPDYTRVQPSPYATSGKSSGTGGGVAASNKSTGVGGATNATSGQGAGTGAGTAASSKGGFSSGNQAYSSPSGGAGSSGALKGGGSSGTLTGKPGTGTGGSKGIGGARSGGRR